MYATRTDKYRPQHQKKITSAMASCLSAQGVNAMCVGDTAQPTTRLTCVTVVT